MKTSSLIITALLGLGIAGAGYYHQEILEAGKLLYQEVLDGGAQAEARPAIPGSYIGKPMDPESWRNGSRQTKELAQEIKKSLKNTKRKEISNFIAKPENRLLLAQWLLAHRELISHEENDTNRRKAADALAKTQMACEALEARLNTAEGSALAAVKFQLENRRRDLEEQKGDAEAPRRMTEVIAMSKEAEQLSKDITANLDWMEQILYTGECERPGIAMGIIAALLAERPNLASDTMKREIATATAVEWARSGWIIPRGIDRADYYLDNWEAQRLNTTFDTLPFWQRRMVCGSKGHDNAGSRESLEWALENVHIPDNQYPGCCWRCGYKLHNYFGESIHGSGYYAPYNGIYGRNRLKMTYEIGGVCGGLSHFGAFSALANGVPAMTAGEPGHCAYIVLVNGKWQPAYSLSWKRGLHWQVWKGVHKYASLHMATALHSPAEMKKTRASNACATLGEMFASLNESDKAIDCYQAAVDTQPLNFRAWRGYAQLLAAQEAGNDKEWRSLHTRLCRNLVPTYPEVAAELLIAHIYPGMLKAITDHSARLTLFSEFWESVEAMGPDRWDIEALCGKQADALKGKNKTESDEATLALYKTVLGLTAGKSAYAPVILAWGNSMAKGMSASQRRTFMAATIRGLESGKDGDMDDAARDRMLGQALSGAEQMRDLSTFQAIGKLLSDNYQNPKGKLPRFEPFPGRIVSKGGMIYTSSSAHDDPAAHWGVLESVGGRFHTNNEVNPWVVVQLPRTALVTGVVAISTSGQNVRRLHDMKVQYSETGRDDDWHEAGAFPAPSTKVINRLDLRESKPRARFIRIMRGGGKDFFHLNAIYVYGEQAS